jgi:hypothetical protein
VSGQSAHEAQHAQWLAPAHSGPIPPTNGPRGLTNVAADKHFSDATSSQWSYCSAAELRRWAEPTALDQ